MAGGHEVRTEARKTWHQAMNLLIRSRALESLLLLLKAVQGKHLEDPQNHAVHPAPLLLQEPTNNNLRQSPLLELKQVLRRQIHRRQRKQARVLAFANKMVGEK